MLGGVREELFQASFHAFARGVAGKRLMGVKPLDVLKLLLCCQG